jgi:prevent-host-death family protein
MALRSILSMTTTASLATVRRDFSAYVAEVGGTHERVVVTRNGVPAAVLISPAALLPPRRVPQLEDLRGALLDADPAALPAGLHGHHEDPGRPAVLEHVLVRAPLLAPLSSRSIAS